MLSTFMDGTFPNNGVYSRSDPSCSDGLGNAYELHPDLDVPSSVLEADDNPHLQISRKPAYEVTLDLLRARSPREITYIVLGPMTNLALMMRADAEFVQKRVGRVVVMGGALDVPGNATPVAECKFSSSIIVIKKRVN